MYSPEIGFANPNRTEDFRRVTDNPSMSGVTYARRKCCKCKEYKPIAGSTKCKVTKGFICSECKDEETKEK